MKDRPLLFPPDRWVHELNILEPNIWTKLRKCYFDNDGIIRVKGVECFSKDIIPDWCYVPTMISFFAMAEEHDLDYSLEHMNVIMTMATLYTWRASRGVYRFEREVYDALIEQPLTGDLPCECLYHLPEWAVYIETPHGISFERVPVEGFIAHLDYNIASGGVDLQFAIFGKGYDQPRMIALPLGSGSLVDAMDRTDEVDRSMIPGAHPHYVGSKDEYKKTFSAMVQLVLYLCSDEPDLPQIEHPQHRRGISGTVRGPKEPRVWDVGVHIASVIRKYKEQEKDSTRPVPYLEGQTHQSPRPHVRAAHWHTYWTGPRKAVFPERKPVIHWLPPIPVGMNWDTEIPTNVHKVV